MKKASAIVLYDAKSNQIYNLTINHNGNIIPLINYSESKVTPYKYKTFNEMYKCVLNFAKNNNFYYGRYKEFGSIWFDVSWIDINNPTKIQKFAFKEGENV